MTMNIIQKLIVLVSVSCSVGIAVRLLAEENDSKSSVGDMQQEVVESSMHEFMEYVYQPTYKRLKVSMKAEPSDRNGWKAIKADSLILAESANLLLMRTPDENGADWNQSAVATRKLGGDLYRAAGEKDFESAAKAYRSMLTNCNACHKKFADGKYQLKP